MSRTRGARVARLSRYGADGHGFNGFLAVCLLTAVMAVVLVGLGAAMSAGARAQEGGGKPVILALGDSLTAGYGLSKQDSFPAELERALAEAGTPARVVNAGVSGDTSKGGLSRVDWLLAEDPDVLLLELGSNDGLRALDPTQTHDNLKAIIEKAEKAGIHVLLAGMMAPPNLGKEYGEDFNAIFPRLAEEHDVTFYPFFLEGVAARPALNQSDGMHPNAEGVDVVVENILPSVQEALKRAGALSRGQASG
ncbi:arylesterase [Marivibrio halodurans]|nr:arylesterase [Marivibrio halodurans]